MPATNQSATGWIGLALIRLVVPAWILTGAVFKLIELSPKTLPKETILATAYSIGIDLYVLLATLLALEFLAIAVMLFVGRFARAMAIFMLTCFCLILLGEMAFGNFSSCGCLGTHSPPPWAMLTIDGLLLIGVLAFKPIRKESSGSSKGNLVCASVATLIGASVSYGIVIPAGRAPEPDPTQTSNNDTPVDPAIPLDPTVNPRPKPLSGSWFASSLDPWIGKPWREIELFQFMPRWPANMDAGTRYVTFYGRTCDHCEEMFLFDFASNSDLASKVVAIEVPVSKTKLRDEANAWPMPDTRAELLELPVGCDWIISTPLTLRIEDGIVTCATEGDHKQCMELD